MKRGTSNFGLKFGTNSNDLVMNLFMIRSNTKVGEQKKKENNQFLVSNQYFSLLKTFPGEPTSRNYQVVGA